MSACPAETTSEAAAAAAAAAASSDSLGSPESSRSSMDDEEAERVQQAVEVVAEMQLTAEQLKVGQSAAAKCQYADHLPMSGSW